MERNLFRTHTSDLSDDELRLLDVLFRGAGPLSSLRRANFADTWNQPYHQLDDDELVRNVVSLCDRGVLSTELHHEQTYVRFTERGAKLWSDERHPLWDRYAFDRYGMTASGKQYATVVTTTPATRDDILRLGGVCGNWQLNDSRLRKFEIRRHTLIPWRTFPRLFVAIVVDLKDEYAFGSEQWRQWSAVFEDRRSWWRDVFELQKFLPSETSGGLANDA